MTDPDDSLDVVLGYYLLAVESGRAVEYGAIQIFLDRFAEPWRSQILGEHLPLGRILNESGMHYTSCPSGYFCCVPDAFMRTALRLDPDRPK